MKGAYKKTSFNEANRNKNEILVRMETGVKEIRGKYPM